MSELIKAEQLAVTTRWITCFNESDKDSFLILAEKESELTIEKCMNFPPIQNLEKEISKKEILKAIRTAVLNTSLAFKFSEKMDIPQATLLAVDLYEFFKTETLEDVFLMLKMARNGFLGSNKGRLDHDTVFNLFVPAYIDKKIEERERQYARQKDMLETETFTFSEENKMKLDRLIKPVSEKVTKKKPVKNDHEIFISRLPELCKNLSDKELKIEMKKAQIYKLTDAYEIYQTESDKRNGHKKTLPKKRKAGNPAEIDKQND
jgi:hypothetical protein